MTPDYTKLFVSVNESFRRYAGPKKKRREWHGHRGVVGRDDYPCGRLLVAGFGRFELDRLERLGLRAELGGARREASRLQNVRDDLGLFLRVHRARIAWRHRDTDALEQVADREGVPVVHELR